MDSHLVALYELKRQTFLLGYIQNPNKFDHALAFAHYHRLAPIFHENIERELYDADPFADVYAVKADFVNEVIKYVDELDLAGNHAALSFPLLEDKFGGYKSKRMELIHSLEYARIDGRFNAEVWSAIEVGAPMEANPLDSVFSPSDVHFS